MKRTKHQFASGKKSKGLSATYAPAIGPPTKLDEFTGNRQQPFKESNNVKLPTEKSRFLEKFLIGTVLLGIAYTVYSGWR